MISDNGKNKIVGLSELNILIIPGIKDRISNGKTSIKFSLPACVIYISFFLLLMVEILVIKPKLKHFRREYRYMYWFPGMLEID